MKVRFLWIGIALIIVSGTCNYIYAQSKQIDGAVFLDHYYQQRLTDGEVKLTFHYLTDKQEPLMVNHVEVDGVDGYPLNGGFSNMFFHDKVFPHEQEFRYQYLMATTLTFRPELLSKEKPWSFHQMVVYFTNGTKMRADIGKVVITSQVHDEQGLKTVMASSTNNHHTSANLVADTSLTIEKIVNPFASELGDDFTYTLQQSDETTLPLSLKKGRHLQFSSNMENHHTYLNFRIAVKGTQHNGGAFTTMLPIYDYPIITESDVQDIVAAEKSGGHHE